MNDELVAQIVETLKQILQKEERFTPLHAPLFEGNEWKYVKECLDTGWVSSVGQYVDLFEQKLAEFVGAKYAIAVVNGTAGLHIALKLSGVEPNDEVFIPTLTFVATANAVTYCNAIPHFVDVEERTLGIDAKKLMEYLQDIAEIRDGQCWNKQTGRRIKAVVAMHTFGHPVDLDALLDVCERYHLTLLEDAAESLGSYYKGKHTGTFGKAGVFSFNGNKIITTGGGGAVVTDDETFARQVKHLTTTAKLPHAWTYFHDQVGYNYRMPNINAALGCAQLEKLPEFLSRKRKLAHVYSEAFQHVTGVQLFLEPEFAKSNYWLNTLLLNDADEQLLTAILDATNSNGIMTRPAWELMHQLPIYSHAVSMDVSTAEHLRKRILNIPSSASLQG
jgi:perosamine synthetase